MELEGKIIKCGEVRSGTSERGNWMTQEFVLETEHRNGWKTRMVFEVFGQDRLQRFGIQEGQFVNVSFEIDAREYNGRWYNSVRAFDVRQRTTNATAPGAETVNQTQGSAPAGDPFEGGSNDCPFGESMS